MVNDYLLEEGGGAVKWQKNVTMVAVTNCHFGALKEC